jgi:hypothetical protein
MSNIIGYPVLTLSEILGGFFKIGLGFIVFSNISHFTPTQSEYIIIAMLCVYGVISGIHDVAPYIDEWADRGLQYMIRLLSRR